MSLGDLEGLVLGPDDALFLDFDGTLAELGPDPDAIWLPEPTWRDLEALARRLGGALAVISGRDVRDLARRVPDGLWRGGTHGLEVVPPGMKPPAPPSPPPETLLAPLRAAAKRPGVWLELKGPVAALHYRAAPEAETACVDAAMTAARALAGHIVQAGKMVVEVKPDAAHKGRALRQMMSGPPFAARRPVMLGDDATDEDAMGEAMALGGSAVKVGPGKSVTTLRASDPSAIRSWLAREAVRDQTTVR